MKVANITGFTGVFLFLLGVYNNLAHLPIDTPPTHGLSSLLGMLVYIGLLAILCTPLIRRSYAWLVVLAGVIALFTAMALL
jgi:hypothetical protein